MIESAAESPCIKVCTLDATGQICLGCFRTLDEIGLWSQLSNRARAQVVAQLPERRTRYEAMSACSQCGAKFECGANDTAKPCWCVSYPALTPSSADATCLCPACLSQATKGRASSA